MIDPNLTKITVTPGSGSAIVFYERSVQPVGFEGSDKVNKTSSQSTPEASGVVIKEFTPGSFVEMSPGAASVLYEPDKMDTILAAINVEGSVVVTFKDGSTITTTGWLKSFTPTGQDTVDNTDYWVADATFEFNGKPAYAAS